MYSKICVAPVGGHRLEAWQGAGLGFELWLEELTGGVEVVRLGRLHRHRERQPEDLDEYRALGPLV